VLLVALSCLIVHPSIAADTAAQQLRGERTAPTSDERQRSSERRTGRSCANIAGLWGMLVTQDTGLHTQRLEIEQRDCEFTATTPIGTLFSGTISGSKMTVSGKSLTATCPFSYAGTGRILDRMLYLTYQRHYRADCGPTSHDIALIGTRAP
jgi:hypothetical protein